MLPAGELPPAGDSVTTTQAMLPSMEVPAAVPFGSGGIQAQGDDADCEDESRLLDQEALVSDEWLGTWLPEMHAHLHAIQSLLGHMVPRVARLLEESDGTADEQVVMRFLEHSTMVGLLPVPHALVMHKYTANEFTQLWFTTFLWGVVFLRNQEFPIYDSRKIRLFAITVE
jgi:hypothetical protein